MASLSCVQPDGSYVGGQPFCGLYRLPLAGRALLAVFIFFLAGRSETQCDSEHSLGGLGSLLRKDEARL